MMSSNNEGKKVVCVTCGSSYIASWLVKLLLLRGYTVKAIVSDPNDPTKIDHLVKLDGAKERLDLVKADIMEGGSFDSVVEGCQGVFHTAPASLSFNHVLNDPQKDLIEPAVKGTLNVLKSCAKSASVKRVVLTSSISAVLYNGKPRSPQVVVDETWFSDPDFLRNTQKWYLVCKSLIEEEAWKFARENNIDMVALNPGMVIGPLLQPSLNDSASTVLKLLKGEIYPNFIMGWGHAKDVANAHIQAFEIPSANGRYCLIERITNYSDVAKLLNHLYPTLQLPEKRDVDDESVVPKYQVSKDKAKTLGIEFIPLEVSLKEMIESLKDNKFVNF